MTIATKSDQKPSMSKKSDFPTIKAAVPFDEMERLMTIYGSIKALRNRGSLKRKRSDHDNGGGVDEARVKKDSIRRKFYRWFPDFEERFFRDEDGQYQPVHGHDDERKYREEMRKKSAEVVSAKRVRSLIKRKTYNDVEKYTKDEKVVETGLPRPVPSLFLDDAEEDVNDEKVVEIEQPRNAVPSLLRAKLFSRQISATSSNASDKTIEGDIEIGIPNNIEMPHIVAASPTPVPSEGNRKSFFFESGNRAPSPLTLPQLTDMAVSEERGTIFSFESEGCSDDDSKDASEPLPFDWQARQNIFDEINYEFYAEEKPSSSDSVEGSLDEVSDGTSSGNSCEDKQFHSLNRFYDEVWGSDSDMEECLVLEMTENPSKPNPKL